MPAIDRSKEFFATVQSLQSKHPIQVPPRPSPSGTAAQRAEFSSRVRHITQDIIQMGEHLETLAGHAKQRAGLDERQMERLTQEIKGEITSINDQFRQLQGVSPSENKMVEEHGKQMLKSLQLRFANLSANYKELLAVKSQTLMVTKQRREQFGLQDAIPSISPTRPPYQRTEGPPPVGSGNERTPLLTHPAPLDPRTPTRSPVPVARPLAQAPSTSSPSYTSTEYEQALVLNVQPSPGTAQALQYAPSTSATDTYYQSRNTAIESIESAVAELGIIFQQLAQLVAAQGETVQRIDEDIEQAHLYVSQGQDELLRYWRNMSSNRWLLMKSFAVLILFIILFSIFFA